MARVAASYPTLGMYPKALAQYQEALKISPADATALRGRELARAEVE
jgi:hypothetical protein